MLDAQDEQARQLLGRIRACTLCQDTLPLGPRPVLDFSPSARILLVGQAPGLKVHQTGKPWNDASGRRLRAWMQISEEQFYDPSLVAIVPMGFCYPGRGKGGDLPPSPRCAPTWHEQILALLPQLCLRIYIGQYAMARYLPQERGGVTEIVCNYEAHVEQGIFPLVHPSPRNQGWLQRNPWFADRVLPALALQVRQALG